MRTRILLMGLLLAAVANAQTIYHDASAFPLLGKATESTLTRYERLPDSLQNISRKPLWDLGRNSAGLAVRFRSNSTSISAKWEVRNNMSMNHMTPTGIKGLDLYCLQDGKWIFAGSGRPQGKINKATIVSNMLPEEREYLLYLSLYDGVTSLSIGVDSLSAITPPAVDLPKREKPVVFYGTSILQGGCASRPGMVHTNVLERWLNRECINLGFSGNALLDLEIADVIAGVDASMFVLDFVPNATVEQMRERADKFYTTFRLYPALTKFFYGRSENLSLTGSYRDRMKFRLSETYLLLCEARLGLNDISGAREAINVVRRRAHAPEITDSEMTMDFLLDERIRELVGEESRRFTLCRTGKLLERTRKYNTESGPVMRDYHTLWPIPQSIIDSNTGAEFPQNEGY